ncbi:hypothetical protein AC579_1511 [Pseudocercospora musae]|uniref:Uncharacterized protein n=1 Tax=Pseudocercospora musae TaxID=113226 RepID=A0A139IKL3_9PEZI|nr:hypothetical protein AC579_1511 [Pseudocercospora musae]
MPGLRPPSHCTNYDHRHSDIAHTAFIMICLLYTSTSKASTNIALISLGAGDKQTRKQRNPHESADIVCQPLAQFIDPRRETVSRLLEKMACASYRQILQTISAHATCPFDLLLTRDEDN